MRLYRGGLETYSLISSDVGFWPRPTKYKAGSCAAEADDWSKAEFYAKAARNGERVENTVDEQFELTTVLWQGGTTKPHKFALLRFFLCMPPP